MPKANAVKVVKSNVVKEAPKSNVVKEAAPVVNVVKSSKAKALKKVKGIAYEVVGTNVVLHKPEGDMVLPLQLGQSAYSVAYLALIAKGTKRNSDGTHKLGNFSYTLDDKNLLTVTRKDGSVLGTKVLTETDTKYPRIAATNLILTTLV